MDKPIGHNENCMVGSTYSRLIDSKAQNLCPQLMSTNSNWELLFAVETY